MAVDGNQWASKQFNIFDLSMEWKSTIEFKQSNDDLISGNDERAFKDSRIGMVNGDGINSLPIQ